MLAFGASDSSSNLDRAAQNSVLCAKGREIYLNYMIMQIPVKEQKQRFYRFILSFLFLFF